MAKMEIVNEKITTSDGAMRSDSFIVDLESFCKDGLSKEATIINSNHSRITLQRNVSRKGAQQRGGDRINSNDRDTLSPSSSPKAATAQVMSTSEKSITASDNHQSGNNSQLPQHQIIIKTGSVTSPSSDQGKWGKKSLTFKRTSSPTLFSNPKRILLFFATLSSMGTILLIYFTLSMGKNSISNVAGH